LEKPPEGLPQAINLLVYFGRQIILDERIFLM